MLSIGLAVLAFLAGIVFLYKGSDILVDGTSRFAAQLGVSALIISVVIVAFGTSAPEFAISVGAAAQHHADISFGNIIGSCIANLLLVIGISAVINPISIHPSVSKRELPIMVLTTVILAVFAFTQLLDAYHFIGGLIFLVLFILFVMYFVQCARKERRQRTDLHLLKTEKPMKNILLIIGGIIGVVLGAWLLIESSLTIADFFGIPPLIISLSMVAIGTSLPELVVSALAAYKKESDIAIGNVLGSNVFNILLVLGFASLLIPIQAKASFDQVLILLGITALMVPVLYSRKQITRIEGCGLLVIYAVYIWYIFLGSSLLMN